MTFYVSVRPLIIDNKMISPKRHFLVNFKGINFTFEQLAFSPGQDGRMLYEINLSNEYSTQQANEYLEVMVDSLAVFNGKLKTIDKAKELADLISTRVWEIKNGKIKPI